MLESTTARMRNALEAIPEYGDPYLSGNQIFKRQGIPRMPRKLLYPLLEELAARDELDSVSIGRMRYYRQRVGPTRIAIRDCSAYNAGRRNEFSLDKDVDWLTQSLSGLRQGKTVLLWLELPRRYAKKKPTTIVRKLVIIIPGLSVGLPRASILVSIVGAGCSVLSSKGKEGLANLVLAGMPASLAKALMNSIHRVLQE